MPTDSIVGLRVRACDRVGVANLGGAPRRFMDIARVNSERRGRQLYRLDDGMLKAICL